MRCCGSTLPIRSRYTSAASVAEKYFLDNSGKVNPRDGLLSGGLTHKHYLQRPRLTNKSRIGWHWALTRTTTTDLAIIPKQSETPRWKSHWRRKTATFRPTKRCHKYKYQQENSFKKKTQWCYHQHFNPFFGMHLLLLAHFSSLFSVLDCPIGGSILGFKTFSSRNASFPLPATVLYIERKFGLGSVVKDSTSLHEILLTVLRRAEIPIHDLPTWLLYFNGPLAIMQLFEITVTLGLRKSV